MPQSVDIFEESLLFQLPFELNINKWNTMDDDIKRYVSSGWKSIKYLNDEGTAINKDISKVPNNSGGIYIFLLKPEVIPQMHRYIMYIGRAHRGANYSLRKRCSTYFTDDRPKIARMIKRWGKELYLFYLPITDSDDFIDKVERELIRVIIPPCNSQIPDHYTLPEQDLF